MAMESAAKVGPVSSLSPKSKKNETGKMPVPRAGALLDQFFGENNFLN
jgi:hypothetical protein